MPHVRRRRVATGEGQLERQLVEPVGRRDVAQPAAAGERAERRLDGGGQAVDERVGRSEPASATGSSASARRSSAPRSGAVKSVCSRTPWTQRADPRPAGTAASGSVDRSGDDASRGRR